MTEEGKIPYAPYCSHLYKKIGTEDTVKCEDHTVEELDNEFPYSIEVRGGV